MLRLSFALSLGALVLPRTAAAQQVTVQQPVFNVFSVNTTVSVPDRGAAYLGGVKRATESRRGFGVFRPPGQSGFGRALDGSSVTARVWFHDFEELDRAALGAAERTRTSPVFSGYSAHAWQSLLDRGRSTSVPLVRSRRGK
ncbi:MAG: hypothetical protein KY476_17770 [Planctomycetes bacterium]|nr:hypothetical protein [Planctomycetota bacterium]